MPVPQGITAHPDLLDRNFTKIFANELQALDEKRTKFFSTPSTRRGADEKYSAIGELGDLVEFTGEFQYGSTAQGYDVTATHKEWGRGMAITRLMRDYDLHNQMESQPAALGRAAFRTREQHAARILTMAFSLDNLFYSHSEGVALCSNSHTTTAPGVSTSVGFDNLGTSALSAVAVSANRIQMKQFRGDVGERVSIRPNELWVPVDLCDTAWEIANSMGKLETANNNANAQQGRWTIMEWDYMSDANDWFMCDSALRKANALWHDSVAPEFAKTGEFDTMDWKWRVYTRYSYLWRNWRFIMGNQVS